MPHYAEEDYLTLSGIQHYAFCPRQWALIHIENLWQENYLTALGRVLHKKVHDGDMAEKRGSTITLRALKISSSKLGISGECDVVEFYESADGISLEHYDGLWKPYPVEYKRGKSKLDDCDRLQLCAQAVCLEEMLCCEIESGAIFYGEPRRREVVDLTKELRESLEKTTKDMHDLFSKNHTPKPKRNKRCSSCSLNNLCLPKICDKPVNVVKKYLEDSIG